MTNCGIVPDCSIRTECWTAQLAHHDQIARVEPEFYAGTKAADPTVSIEEIDGLCDHGVEPEYLKEIRALPDRFSTSDISELRDHGIAAKYIRDLHDMGMKNLTAAQIVHLREGNSPEAGRRLAIQAGQLKVTGQCTHRGLMRDNVLYHSKPRRVLNGIDSADSPDGDGIVPLRI
jgi:hypothetical protein